ncbi:MAG: TIR domain-containing protein [Arcicella sp.]|jgi:hypothetical protein|nr:TIR domain-containing protein [Arcicella sp.]
MTHWIDQIEWDKIITQIKNQKCVLVIGPDLVNYPNNQSLFQLLCESINQETDLQNHVESSLKHGFEHEELLQLKPYAQSDLIYDFLEKFYDSRNEFDAPYQQISQLPFHLIISLLPDKRLQNVFKETGTAYDFDYFSRITGQDKPDLKQNPTKEKPLIYNIMGVLDREEAVLTFDDMFQYLQNILFNTPSSLPTKLLRAFDNASSFLFLGVHFEKWYMQVLLRLFLPNDKNRRLKYSLLRDEQNHDSYTFFAQRLELDFLPVEPQDFLNELHKRFKEKEELKVRKRVFISYSHQDMEVAKKLRDKFEAENISVMMDEISMPAGEKVRNFMKKVNEVDKVVVIVSENSLKSPFVCKEIYLSFKNHKSLIPCHLDMQFLDKNHVPNTRVLITDTLTEINRLISERKAKDLLDPVSDLMQEEELWREFGVYLPEQIAQLQGSKSIAIGGDNYDNGLQQLMQNILL